MIEKKMAAKIGFILQQKTRVMEEKHKHDTLEGGNKEEDGIL